MSSALFSTTRNVRIALGLVAAALIASPLALAPSDSGTLVERVFGPFAEFAANVQWVRADFALRHARYETAYARAESALELAPSASGGWIFLARHFVYQRASVEREPDAEARRRWTQAGLDILERGLARCTAPADLHFERGVICTYLAFVVSEPELPRDEAPDVRPASELFDAAAREFDRAAELGDADGASNAAAAREQAHTARAAGR